MKPTTIRSILLGLAFVALAGVAAPQAVQAQIDASGTFTLPCEVHWGSAVLPAGTYNFSTDTLSSSALVKVSKESNPSASYLIPAQGWDTLSNSAKGTKLVLDNKNGEVYVRELQMGDVGLGLIYSEPKPKK